MKAITKPLREPLKSFQVDNCQHWISELRSGEFKQANGTLFRSNDNSYCCLGVACKIKGMYVNLSRFQYRGFDYGLIPPVDYFEFVYGFKPDQILAMTDFGLPCDLPTLNDNYHFTFKQIADIIESVCITRTSITIDRECQEETSY